MEINEWSKLAKSTFLCVLLLGLQEECRGFWVPSWGRKPLLSAERAQRVAQDSRQSKPLGDVLSCAMQTYFAWQEKSALFYIIFIVLRTF